VYLRDISYSRAADLHFKHVRIGGYQLFPKGFIFMKNPMEVLRTKEDELTQVRKQVDALRITARLLDDKNTASIDGKVDLRQVIEMP
jgi:CMP-2-keto-3-deoxyoctulosonic acid synthetase